MTSLGANNHLSRHRVNIAGRVFVQGVILYTCIVVFTAYTSVYKHHCGHTNVTSTRQHVILNTQLSFSTRVGQLDVILNTQELVMMMMMMKTTMSLWTQGRHSARIIRHAVHIGLFINV